MTLTKRDLVLHICEETGLPRLDVQKVVQRTLDLIAESLGRGDKIEFRNFGVFSVRTRKPRIGRNPKRPEVDVPIPLRSVVKFKAGRLLKVALAALPPVQPSAEKKPAKVKKPLAVVASAPAVAALVTPVAPVTPPAPAKAPRVRRAKPASA